MQFSIKGIVVLTLDHKPGEKNVKHLSTDFNLEVSAPLDENMYFEDGLPNENGVKNLTNLFVQGLIGNIQLADQKGYRNSATHLRHVISELERGVFSVVNIKESKFGKEVKDGND